MTEPTRGFISGESSEIDCWRGVVLFGRNVASYKFALAKSLLELSADDAARLFKPDSTYTVELFEV